MDDQQIIRTLGNLEAKVDILLERSAAADIQREKLTQRVVALEQQAASIKTWFAVTASTVALVVTALSDYISSLFKH